jgi:putative ABC transport system permease protein
MRFADLLSLPLSALWQQKLRTVLTTMGVVFGAFVLSASLSIGIGVQDIISRIANRSDLLRKIHVHPRWAPPASEQDDAGDSVEGQFTAERKKRLAQALPRANTNVVSARVSLDRPMLAKLRSLPHVQKVVPFVQGNGFAVLGDESQSTYIASSPIESPDCERRLVAGRFFQSEDERALVVHESVLYQLGLRSDDDFNAAIGRKLRLEFRPFQGRKTSLMVYLTKSDGTQATRDEQALVDKITGRLPEIVPQLSLSPTDLLTLKKLFLDGQPASRQVISEEFEIVGILRTRTPEDEKGNWDPFWVHAPIVLPSQTALDLLFRIVPEEDQSAERAVVVADDERECKDLVKQLNEMGLNAWAPLEHIERERLMYLLIFGGMTCVAAVAVLVAALGITNTMLMSVLERTREIGIMKAVGAGNGTLQFIFILEGALIGLFGGSLGLLACFGASYPGDAYIHNRVTRDMQIEIEGSLFAFTPTMMIAVIGFSVLVTTLAAVIPARRAARIDPVTALRYE